MQQDVAWHIIRVVFRCSADLQSLLRILKENCDAEEYQHYARGVAAAIDAINVQLMDRVLADHPELTKRIESDLAKHGRIT